MVHLGDRRDDSLGRAMLGPAYKDHAIPDHGQSWSSRDGEFIFVRGTREPSSLSPVQFGFIELGFEF